MPRYRVCCYASGCAQEAAYKIAARWSDGLTGELKTYGLTCAEHLPGWFHKSLATPQACRKAKNETLERPGIYRLHRGASDVQLQRLEDLERRLLASLPSA